MNPRLMFSALAVSASLVASADITGLPDLTDDIASRASISGNDDINGNKTNGQGAFDITRKDGAAATQSDINNNATANRLGLKVTTSNSLWVTYGFTTNTVVNAYRIWNQHGTASYKPGLRAPKAFYLEGSSDGTEWTMLDSQSGQTDWDSGEPRVFEFRNKTAYQFYRMTFTANNGDSDGWLMIQELEYFCRPTFSNSLTVVGSPANYGSPSPAYGTSKAEKDGTVEASVATPAEIDTGMVAGCVGWKTEKQGDEDDAWTELASGDGNETSFSHPGGKVRLTWNFEVSNRVETVVHGDESWGTVSGGGWFLKGATATLKATPSAGCDFISWIGDTSGVADPTAAEISVKADSPRTLKAFFVPTGSEKVVYVSPNGDDGNDGMTEANAKATIGAAVAWLDQTFMEGKIIVAPGLYEQTKEFVLSNAIEVVGSTGNPEDVVLRNTMDRTRVVNLRNSKALVSGVAIENIKWMDYNLGGNVLIAGGADGGGTVSNCVIRNGQATAVKGGNIAVCSVNSLVTHCVISNGAIAAVNGGEQDVSGTAIYVRPSDGGGRISNCLITQNTTVSNGLQRTDGRKMHVVYVGGPTLMDNCTIVDNCHTGLAAVVYAAAKEGTKIYNCVIANNTTPEGTAVPAYAGDASRFVNCVTDGDEPINENCRVGTLAAMFASTTDGRWWPQAGGPLDGAGTTDGITVPTLDLRGKPRIHGSKIDVGCYEISSSGLIFRIR